MTQIHDTDRRNALLVAEMLRTGATYSKRSDKWTIHVDGAGTLPLAEYLLKTLAESDASADRLALDTLRDITAREAATILDMVTALKATMGKNLWLDALVRISEIETALRHMKNRGRS